MMFLILCFLIFIAMILWNGFKETVDQLVDIAEQLKKIGGMFDWSKEINTSIPKYYKWTQWLFLELYNNTFYEFVRQRNIQF